MHYMIVVSKKMTSQKKLGELESVPYNKPLQINVYEFACINLYIQNRIKKLIYINKRVRIRIIQISLYEFILICNWQTHNKNGVPKKGLPP
jgi:hypothetical protein